MSHFVSKPQVDEASKIELHNAAIELASIVDVDSSSMAIASFIKKHVIEELVFGDCFGLQDERNRKISDNVMDVFWTFNAKSQFDKLVKTLGDKVPADIPQNPISGVDTVFNARQTYNALNSRLKAI